MWIDGRIGAGAALALAAGFGVVAGLWTPRGPLTTGEALWSMLISAAVGVVAGVAMRSRWAMLLMPAVFAVVFELVRLDATGPTVDAIKTSFYGLLAFGVGRGFHALLSLAPMVLGATGGAALARQLEPASNPDDARHRRTSRYGRRGVAVLATVGFVATVAMVAQPTSTDPIVDANGDEVPGSIAELTTLDVNGCGLPMMIRGHSVDNPVLLFLAGGPGGSEMGSMRNHLSELEQHFTVVTWDQRGAGKSYPELDPTDTITLDGHIDDTIEVTDYLRDRFDQDQIYLLGQSWGSTLGVYTVQQRPELYRAFIGTGQMVSQLATDRIFYQDTLDWATATGDTGLVEELNAIGPPPYED